MNRSSLKEIAILFLKLGITSFGGPTAHIAMMQHEVVEKRNWMSREYFLDLIALTNLIPGPNSTEMAIHIGRERAGWKGLWIAGISFIAPAVLITGIIAWLYKLYGQLPQLQPFIYGIEPAIIAIILGAVYPLARTSVKSPLLAIIGMAVFIGSVIHINEIYLMYGAGMFVLLTARIKIPHQKNWLPVISFLQITNSTVFTATPFSLFWIFLKIGAILFGSGYVLFAFLDTELVSRGILSRQQLMDAIAVGQFTPGPVFSAVTFIGYQILGLQGAVVSTLGVFLPSFVFVASLNPFVKRLRKSVLLSSFMDAVNVASVALILSVCTSMSRNLIADWRTLLIMILSILVTFSFRKVNSVFIVLGSSLAGYLLTFI